MSYFIRYRQGEPNLVDSVAVGPLVLINRTCHAPLENSTLDSGMSQTTSSITNHLVDQDSSIGGATSHDYPPRKIKRRKIAEEDRKRAVRA